MPLPDVRFSANELPSIYGRAISIRQVPGSYAKGPIPRHAYLCDFLQQLPLEVYQFLQHLIGRGNDPRVSLETSLGDDHVSKLLG